MNNQDFNQGAFQKAKLRVEKLRGFYNHLFVFLTIAGGITIYEFLSEYYLGQPVVEVFFAFGSISVWVIWGFILGIHAVRVFGFPLLFNTDWEERKLKQFMNDEQQSWKQ